MVLGSKFGNVAAAMKKVYGKFKEHFSEVFKTITTDNGSEFSSLSDVETWCNTLPRKILKYRTPDEVFEEEVDRIYQIAA